MNHKRWIAALLALCLLLPACAMAAGQYIIPDSGTRALTREELRQWSYESLGFILNEIFARHGYHFEVGKKYYNYFNQRPWYTPNTDPDNSRACYSQLSNLEWQNEHLVKEVREEMRAAGTRNEKGKHYLDYIGDEVKGGFTALSGFWLVNLQTNQRLDVYAAPGTSSYRGAKGKAVVSTNGPVYAAGWDGGWLLMMYETNNGSIRVGYVDGQKMKDSLSMPALSFDRISVEVLQNTAVTDDPARSYSEIAQLTKGTQVIYLSEYQNHRDWAYVETTAGGKLVRGFVDIGALDMSVVDAAQGYDGDLG